MFYDFETKQLKNYKGYEIYKAWRIDSDNKRIKKYGFFYLVAEDDDYIGEEYNSLNEAKKFVDSIA